MITSAMLLMVLAMPVQEAPAQEAPAPEAQAETTSAPSMSADEHIQAGLAAFQRRRFAAARTHFQQAVDADPNSAAAHFYLGYTIYKIAEPKRPNSPGKQEAAGHFAKAYELDPAFVPAWRRRG